MDKGGNIMWLLDKATEIWRRRMKINQDNLEKGMLLKFDLGVNSYTTLLVAYAEETQQFVLVDIADAEFYSVEYLNRFTGHNVFVYNNAKDSLCFKDSAKEFQCKLGVFVDKALLEKDKPLLNEEKQVDIIDEIRSDL